MGNLKPVPFALQCPIKLTVASGIYLKAKIVQKGSHHGTNTLLNSPVTRFMTPTINPTLSSPDFKTRDCLPTRIRLMFLIKRAEEERNLELS